MSAQHSAMRFAVRPAVILRMLADMYGVLALLTMVPGTVSLSTQSEATRAYALVVALLALLWLAGRLLPEPRKVQQNEALTMIALLFISTSLFFSIPLMAYGIAPLDAWFEAVSGVTTTGLSTLSISDAPSAMLFGRGWMQWIGGIGVVVLALALFITPGTTANRLGFTDNEMDDIVGGTRAHARRVIMIYLIITLGGTFALYLCGSSLLDAVVHCMAAVSTGGFANYTDSLASVGAAELLVINVLCIAGAISFHLYYRSMLFTTRRGLLDQQLYALLAALLVATAAIWLLARLENLSVSAADLATLAISAQTTAGFSTVSIAELPVSIILILCICMGVGGGVGSTSGGLKLDRALVILRQARRLLVQTGLPEQVHLSNRDQNKLAEITGLLCWFLAALLLSWLAFIAHGYPPAASLFEVTSALATAGLSAGITGADLPPFLKFVLCCNMLLGRLEIIAILVLFAPNTWIGRRRKLQRGT
ncbi:MAG: TrkH family potassium uptake protein [Halioglobus sp.]